MKSPQDMHPSRFHNLEPDYDRPIYKLPADTKNKLLQRLESLYGKQTAQEYIDELERVVAVYYAHKRPEMFAWEEDFSPHERFTEKDAILITYGDLIMDASEKPLQTLAHICRTYLRGVFNTIHILPFFPFSSDRGFAIRDFTQVDPNLGTWEDINDLNNDFKLMFDGVFNHISSKSAWFQEFLNGNPEFDEFFTFFNAEEKISEKDLNKLVRPRTTDVLTPFQTYRGKKLVWTTFSPDQIDLNFRNLRVLIKIIEILLIYVRRGADIIRLDAVTFLWDELGTTGAHLEETHTIIKLFRDILDTVAPHVALITETNVPHEDNISYFGNGNDEAQMVYNFALPPLILHTFQTGNASKLTEWAKSLENPSKTATFFNFLDSHDGIGIMGARGILTENEITTMADKALEHGGLVSYKSNSDGTKSIYELNITFYSALNREDSGENTDFQVKRYIAARSIPLVIVGVPGVYFHGLIGSKNDIQAVMETNIKRNINRDILKRSELIAALENEESATRKVSYQMSRMIHKRIEQKAFHPCAEQKVLNVRDCFFSVLRTSRDNSEHLLAVTNITPQRQLFEYKLEGSGAACKTWFDLLSKTTVSVKDCVITMEMDPYDICWLKAIE